MLLFEEYVSELLTIHTIMAAMAVAVSTHLVVWLRVHRRRTRALRRFAIWNACLYSATLLLGMMLYPTYKVRVRAEYLDNPSAIGQAHQRRAQHRVRTAQQNVTSWQYRTGLPAGDDMVPEEAKGEHAERRATAKVKAAIARGAKVALWFDVKEHWAALGALIAAAVAFMLYRKHPPKAGPRASTQPVLGLAVVSMLICWAAAIIGIATTAAHSVAPL